MKSKTAFSFVLLTIVAVSVVFALLKVTPDAATSQDQAAASNESGIAATPVRLDAKLAETQFSAVYFHAPHRCPTFRKIESFSHETLTPEIEARGFSWPVEAPDGTIAKPLEPSFKNTCASTVGFPRDSSTS